MNTEQAIHWQKMELQTAIRLSEDGEELRKFRNQFELIRPLWNALEYFATVEEIRSCILCRALDLRDEEYGYLDKIRKNDKSRRITENNIRDLTDIICTMGD